MILRPCPPPTPGRQRKPARHRVWQSRNFRLLVAGSTVNNLGGPITVVALAFAVLDLGGTATELGLVVGAYALAEVLTTLFGGVLGDRLPAPLMMQGSAAASAVIQGVVAASWSALVLDPVLGGMGVVNGVVSAAQRPELLGDDPADRARAGPRRSDLDPADLPPTAPRSVGYGIAGVLVAAYGSGWAIAVDAMTYAVAALCFSLLRVPPLPPTPRDSMLRDLGGGLREVLRHTWLWLLIGQALIYHLFFGGVQGVLGPIVVGHDFGRQVWGWSLSALMGGFLVAAC